MVGQARLRMFAGPNGSGKSTLKDVVPAHFLGTYLNADDIQIQLRSEEGLDLASWPVSFNLVEIESSLEQFGPTSASKPSLHVSAGRLRVESAPSADYCAAAITDLLRRKLILAGETFSFETVMSHESKIKLLAQARSEGYRTYLYYVATEDPDINVQRVASRVQFGGHNVPVQKIRERYGRSLDLLPQAIQNSDRAYIFDNSTLNEERVWIAEFDGPTIELKVPAEKTPKWFESSVLRRLRKLP